MKQIFIIIFLTFLVTEIQSSNYDFYQLKPYEEKSFSIFERSELFYSFENSNPESDLVLRFKRGEGYYVNIYAYTSEEDIKKEDEKFVNYKWTSKINKKALVVKIPKEFLNNQNQKIFFVIKDEFGFFYQDDIMIFNEEDIKTLEHNSPVNMINFYSKNKYIFEFEGNLEERVNLNVISQNKEIKLKINILLNNQEILAQETSDLAFEYNTDKKSKGTYRVTVSKIEPTTTDETVDDIFNIAMYKTTKLVQSIPINEHLTTNFIRGGIFYYYADIDQYDTDETGVVTVEISINTFIKKYMKNLYAKVTSADNDSDEVLHPLMPKTKEETNTLVQAAPDMDYLTHIYFKKQKPEEGKKEFLLISISLETNNEYFNPDSLLIALSERTIVESISSSSPRKFEKTISLKNYIPQFIQINIENNDQLSYVFYSSEPFIQTIYNGTLLSSNNKLNTYSYPSQIFGLGKGLSLKAKTYIFKLFGQEQKVTFRMESTTSEVIFYNKFRPQKVISRQLLDCSVPFYIVGNYDSPFDSKYYFEELFGSFNIGYKNFDQFMEDVSKGNSIFPSLTLNKAEKFQPMVGLVDLLTIQCTKPGYFNLHLLYYKAPDKVSDYSITTIYMDELTKDIDLPASYATKPLYIELISPLGKVVEVHIKNDAYRLGPDKKKELIKLDENYASYLSLISKETNNLFQLLVTSDPMYIIKTEGSYKSNDKNIMFVFENNKDKYKEVKIHIDIPKSSSTDKTEYSYFFGRMEKDYTKYLPLPSYSYHEKIFNNPSFDITITNPYDKYPQSELSSDEDLYFLAIQFTYIKENEIKFEYIKKNEYPEIPQKEYKVLDGTNNKFKIAKDSTVNNLNIIALKCDDKNYDLKVTYYETPLSTYHLDKKAKAMSQENFNIDMQVEIGNPLSTNDENYSGVQVSYFYKNDVKIDEIEKTLNSQHSIKQKDKGSSKIEWDPLENVAYYELYIISQSADESKYINNGCYLSSLSKQNEINAEKEKSIIAKKLGKDTEYDIELNGKFKINIIGITEDDIPLRVIYSSLEAEISKAGGSLLWLYITAPCVLLFILVMIIVFLKMKKRNNVTIPEAGTTLLAGDNE